jgi:5-hydroxyisourate hydrolase
MSFISTHVLDTARGFPAAEVPVLLEVQNEDGSWEAIAQGVTNSDGRVPTLLPQDVPIGPGIYRVTFDTATYFRSISVQGFFPCVTVTFERRRNDLRHLHIPLLISPHGYSTYRGS